mgnify:CR=1 FL=1
MPQPCRMPSDYFGSTDTGVDTSATAVADSDPALVEMVLRNLIANAIRYTERGGVLIAVRPRGDTLVVRAGQGVR